MRIHVLAVGYGKDVGHLQIAHGAEAKLYWRLQGQPLRALGFYTDRDLVDGIALETWRVWRKVQLVDLAPAQLPSHLRRDL